MNRDGRTLRRMIALAGLVTVLFAGLTGTAAPIGASVPGQAFTETSCDGYSDSVARLYTAGLDRAPEQSGFDFWMTEYTEGRQSFRSMATFFASSPEFTTSYGTLSDTGFVQQIYRNVLGREGEPEGVNFWSGQLAAGAPRATILMRFAESPENITNSGTSQPTLGAFNEGLSRPWSCPEWFITQPLSATDGCRVLPGRAHGGAPIVRLTITNPRNDTATGTAWLAGTIDGVLVQAGGSQIRSVLPGETVDFVGVLGPDAFETAPLQSISCTIRYIRWFDDPIIEVEDGCVLGGLSSTGLRRFSTTVTNPLDVPASGFVDILPKLDGRRINTQLQAALNVTPGATVTTSHVITSDRLRNVPLDRISCQGIGVFWIKD